jgi:putative ABC transport system substrate-binding protein
MQVDRRRYLVAAGALLALPQWAAAQIAGRRYRIGWLTSTADSYKEPWAVAFLRRLAELGFVEGRNLTVERRHPGGRLERLPAVAAELGKLNCDAYFGSGNEANLAALAQASPHTPIVFVAVDFDPVATGDVASLARPGGRVTGITALSLDLTAKRLELLKELLPNLARLAVLANEQTAAQLALVQGTARRLGLAVHLIDLKRPPFDYAAAFAEAAAAKSEALFVLGSALWVPAMRQIPALALKARLPTVFHHSGWANAGGLMSYGFNFPAMWHRAAELLGEVLNGAHPGETPMEQPTSYEFVLNLRTARALGVRIPPLLQARADRLLD